MSEQSLEKNVLEIKDKSELMIDLAYSSLLYDNKIIAKEVYDLEDMTVSVILWEQAELLRVFAELSRNLIQRLNAL